MSCECGQPVARHCSRCAECQRAAVLEALGWDEPKARRQSERAGHEVAERSRGHYAAKNVYRRNQRQGRAR